MIWVVEMASGAFGTFWPKAAFSTERKAREWMLEWQKDADDKGERIKFQLGEPLKLDPIGWST